MYGLYGLHLPRPAGRMLYMCFAGLLYDSAVKEAGRARQGNSLPAAAAAAMALLPFLMPSQVLVQYPGYDGMTDSWMAMFTVDDVRGLVRCPPEPSKEHLA